MRNFTCYFRIFKLALQGAAVDGSKAVHIGDNYVSTCFFFEAWNYAIYVLYHRCIETVPGIEFLFTLQELDYLAARNAGMRSLLLVRNDKVCTYMW